MTYKSVVVSALLGVFALPFMSLASDYDGSKPLLCSIIKIMECTMMDGCQEVMAEEVNLPRFAEVNVGQKVIQTLKSGEFSRSSAIKRIEVVDNKLILQGAEEGRKDVRDGFGWTMAIMQDTGHMVMTASGDHVGNVIFGACTPR